MFYIELKQPKARSAQPTPCYKTLNSPSKSSALRDFNKIFHKIITTKREATHIASLFEDNVLIHEAFVSRTETVVDGFNNGQHAMDHTVYHDKRPDGLIDALRPLLYFKHFSFPNGSNYSEEMVKTGKFTIEQFGEVTISSIWNGFAIRVGEWDVYTIPRNYVYGSGADFGAYFSNRDKFLSAFVKRG
jgi:hypothetical protein